MLQERQKDSCAGYSLHHRVRETFRGSRGTGQPRSDEVSVAINQGFGNHHRARGRLNHHYTKFQGISRQRLLPAMDILTRLSRAKSESCQSHSQTHHIDCSEGAMSHSSTRKDSRTHSLYPMAITCSTLRKRTTSRWKERAEVHAHAVHVMSL